MYAIRSYYGGPPTEPNIGPPNILWRSIGCGDYLIVNLGTPITVTMTITNTPPDLVYYEIINPFDIFAIEMDWVVVDIGPTNTGPWITVFDWGA